MTKAQAAWGYLTGAFLIAAVVLRAVDPSAIGYSLTCLVVAVLGWATLLGMLLSDRRSV